MNDLNELRERGNESFKQGLFKKAVNYYSQAINTALESSGISEPAEETKLKELLKNNDSILKCYNNRAQCYLKLESYVKAADDASKGKFIPRHHSTY